MIFEPNSNLRNFQLTLYGIPVISVGRLVREELKDDTDEFSRRIKDEIDKAAEENNLPEAAGAKDFGEAHIARIHNLPYRNIREIDDITIPEGISDKDRKNYLIQIVEANKIPLPDWLEQRTEDEKLRYIENYILANQKLKDLRDYFDEKQTGIVERAQSGEEEARVSQLKSDYQTIVKQDELNTKELKKLLDSFTKSNKITKKQRTWILGFRYYNEDDLRDYLIQNTKLGEDANAHLINPIIQHKRDGNIKELEKDLTDFQSAGLITDANKQKIHEFVITDKEFDNYLRTNTKLDGQEVNKLIKIKNKEHEIEREWTEKSSEITKLTQKQTKEIMRKARLELALKNNSVGIEIREGQKLIYTEKEIVGGKRTEAGKRKAEIKTVTALDEHSILIHLALYDESGKETEPLTLTLSEFEKWVQEHDVYQYIQTKEELEARINFQNEGIGIDIQPGTVIEIDEMDTNSTDPLKSKTPKKITIQDVDEQERTITLDQPVLFKTDAISKDEKFAEKKTLNFGEFLRWYLANKGEKDYSSLENPVEELQNDLTKLNYNLNKKFQRNPEEFPPIELKPGELLYYNDGSDEKFQIQDVDKDKVSFSSGENFTLPQFSRWVKNNHVEKHDGNAEVQKTKNLMLAMDKSKEEAEQEAKKTKDDIEKNKGKDEDNAKNNDPNKDADRVSRNFFKDLWDDTVFLSFRDCIEMAKATWEFVKRKNETWGKHKFSAAGQQLPGRLGTEFKKINQQTENEEVNQYKEGFEQQGVDKIKQILYRTRSSYEAKACFLTLSEKGQIRWDDKEMWNTLDRLSGCRALNGRKINVEDDCQKVIDYLWGTDTWQKWYNDNESNYKSKRDQFQEIAKKVESNPKDTGGLVGECQRMLYEFLHGEYVDPAQYEAMIYYAIDKGKMHFEDKLFFIVMGIGAVNKNGKTLLARDRADVIEGELLTKFPVLDFFISKNEKGLGWTVDQYKGWIRDHISPTLDYIKAAPKDLRYTKAESFRRNFVEKFVLTNQDFIYRLEKTSRYSENWDHDDMHIFGALLDDSSISDICAAQTGSKASITVEGHKNVYAGFSQQLKGMMQTILEIKNGQEEFKEMTPEQRNQAMDKGLRRIAKLFKAQVRFDAIMQNRYDQGNNSLSRLTDEKMDSICVVGDPTKMTREYRNESSNFIRKLATENDFYRDNLQGIDINQVYDMSNTHLHERNNAAREQTRTIDTFGKTLGDIVIADIQFNNGKHLIEFIEKNIGMVKGLSSVKSKDMEKQKRLAKEAEKKEAVVKIDPVEQRRIAAKFLDIIEKPPSKDEITARKKADRDKERDRLIQVAQELKDGTRKFASQNVIQQWQKIISKQGGDIEDEGELPLAA